MGNCVRLPIILLLALLFTGPGLAAARSQEILLGLPTQALRAQEIPPQTLTFRTKCAWTEFWGQYSASPAPLVDFSAWQIAAVFLGRQPNPGYGVEITGYTVTDSALTINYTRFTPAPGRVYIQVITYPYAIVALPARGEVTFYESTRTRQPAPPVRVTFRTLETAPLRVNAPPQYTIFTNTQTWRSFWCTYGKGVLPKVDFSQAVVIGIIPRLGCVAPEITRATRSGNRLALTLTGNLKQKSPSPAGQQPTLIVVPQSPRINLTLPSTSPSILSSPQ